MEKTYYINIFDKKNLVVDKDGSVLDLGLEEIDSANLFLVLWNLDFEIYDLSSLNFFEKRSFEKTLSYGEGQKISLIRDLGDGKKLVHFFKKRELMEKLNRLSQKNKIKKIYLGIDLISAYVLKNYDLGDFSYRLDFGRLYLDMDFKNGKLLSIDRTTEEIKQTSRGFHQVELIDSLVTSPALLNDLELRSLLPYLTLKRYRLDSLLEISKFISLAIFLLVLFLNFKSYRNYKKLEEDYLSQISRLEDESIFEVDYFLDLSLDLIENLPEGVYIESLDLGEESYLVGFADRLRDIFIFKNKMNQSYDDLSFKLVSYSKTENGIHYTISIR